MHARTGPEHLCMGSTTFDRTTDEFSDTQTQIELGQTRLQTFMTLCVFIVAELNGFIERSKNLQHDVRKEVQEVELDFNHKRSHDNPEQTGANDQLAAPSCEGCFVRVLYGEAEPWDTLHFRLLTFQTFPFLHISLHFYFTCGTVILSNYKFFIPPVPTHQLSQK